MSDDTRLPKVAIRGDRQAAADVARVKWTPFARPKNRL